MPLIYQKQITADDLRANPDVLYLFGDNGTRLGLGGQARIMRGKRNTQGILTKWKPRMEEGAFLSDDDFSMATYVIDGDFRRPRQQIQAGGVVVCPLDGLGTGLADLPTRAPRIMEYIRDHLRTLHTLSKETMK